MIVVGNAWDVDNEEEVSEWDEGAQPAFKRWPTEGELTGLLDADMVPYIVGFSQSQDKWDKACLLASNKGLKRGKRGWFRYLAKLPMCFSAIDHADETVNKWIDGAGCDSALLYLTEGRGNYRFDVAFSREYKGTKGRKKEKPPFFELVKWHLVKEHGAIVSFEEEADDLMAIEQYQRNQELALDGAKQGSKSAKRLSDTVIITKDKDLRMIPGWHSNPDIEGGKKFWVNRFGQLFPKYTGNKITGLKGEGLIWFYAQMLVGDSVDNYTGIPGCGPAKAYRELLACNSIAEMYDCVEVAYYDKYGPDKFMHTCWTGKRIKVNYLDMLVQQGRLAWMQNFKGDMWYPKHKLPKPKRWGRPDEA